LNRASDAAKEVSRLLDREIQKTQVRGDIASSQASAALEAKRFGLDLKEFGLDLAKFNFEQVESNRNYNLRKKDTLSKIMDRAVDNKADKQKQRQQKKEASRRITSRIQEGINTVASKPQLSNMLARNPKKVVQRLMKILGSATAANAVVQLMTDGRLSNTTKRDLKQIGYIIPQNWR
jgi:hypothetical protein